MGEHETLSQESGLLLNGLLPDEMNHVTRLLDAERWSKVEERGAELIACIQNQQSEKRRNDVSNYVKTLIKKCFPCEVLTYGSVPFKTYLPDADIDLTICCESEDMKDTWASVILRALENERRQITSSEFHVKEIKYIDAQVRVIKCLVENIVVDISFNQIGGILTLEFLEEVDHFISQNHLFKRSVILIKAWCYYESRILGARFGLISTYTLEILVLYIFHVFNNSFAGPFEVLYRFLEVFSIFDWNKFCVSLWGPVPIDSLPDTTAELPLKNGGKLLFDKAFIEGFSTSCVVSESGQKNQGLQFISKHFNVIDPLRTNNNLGRSVSKANFFRIRSAFAFGAKKLANLLDCPEENLIVEADRFFLNTWERHRRGIEDKCL